MGLASPKEDRTWQFREISGIGENGQQILEENRFYCEKWGLRPTTHEHVICTMDLNDIRAQAEQRLVEDGGF